MKQLDFIIYSAPRGGSTLLTALLNSHPQIVCMNDTLVFKLFFDFLKMNKRQIVIKKINRMFRKTGIVHKVSQKIKNSLFQKHIAKVYTGESIKIDIPNIPPFSHLSRFMLKEYLSELKEWSDNHLLNVADVLNRTHNEITDYESFFTLVFNSMRQMPIGTNSITFGEKTPKHIYYSNFIHTLYPHIKAIQLVRNPFSGIAGLYKREPKNLAYVTNLYKTFYDRQRLITIKAENLLVVRYEDLIADTSGELNKIYKFLDKKENGFSGKFVANQRGEYIGGEIDNKRELQLFNFFDEKQKKYIYRECKDIFDQFYPEFHFSENELNMANL